MARVNSVARKSTDGLCGPAAACADRARRTRRLDLAPAPYAHSVPDARLAIAHVTPYPWGAGHHEITTFVQRATAELAARGHQILIVAPSRSSEAVRETRQALSAARDDPASLLPEPGAPPRVLAVGDALPDLPGGRRRTPALPVDVSRTIEDLLTIIPLDVCHVHEPFAPSTSSAALRHSRALNVGTFHLPTERLLSTQVARKVVQLVLGRLDARTASFGATRDLMQRFFPADYRVLTPGADPPAPRVAAGDDVVRFGFYDDEERPALRLFLRALRRLSPDAAWEATIVSLRGPSSEHAVARGARVACALRDARRAQRGRAAREQRRLRRRLGRRLAGAGPAAAGDQGGRRSARVAAAGLRGGPRRGRARAAVRAARHRDACRPAAAARRRCRPARAAAGGSRAGARAS